MNNNDFIAIPVFLVAVLSGLLYSLVFVDGTFIGAFYAPFIILPSIAFERRLIFRRLRSVINDLATPAYLIVRAGLLSSLFVVGFAFAGLLLWCMGETPMSFYEAVVPPFPVWACSMGISFLLGAALRVRELLGRQKFRDVIFSRYRRPVEEQRVFLFLDVVGSTAYAKRFGALAAARYLGRIFKLVAAPVANNRGSIDDYAGDAVLISWRARKALSSDASIKCAFDILSVLELNASRVLETFSATISVRILIHCGSVVTAEIGAENHKITYFGDTINAVGKLEQAVKPSGPGVYITDAALRAGVLPPSVRATLAGRFLVKGLDQEVVLYALHTTHSADQAPPLQAAAA
ncbi:MAG: cya1 [Rhizobium sp.]|nr:cya1 [Rhizobium sp.]